MGDKARVLVGYATAAGSTADIAARIAARLEDAGHEVVCRPVGPDLDPHGFDACVLGSAVHGMSWLPPALDFLRRAAASGDLPVWCFSVGGLAPRGRRSRWLAAKETARIQQAFALTPRDHRLFAGVVVTEGMPWLGRAFWRAAGGHPGDQRDWPAIEAWAGDIAAEVAQHRATLPQEKL